MEDLTYEALKEIAEQRLVKIKQLESCVEEWRKAFHPKAKHILQVEGTLTTEQAERLKEQMTELFGKGNAILLEGGVKYLGVTGGVLSEAA